MSAHLALIVLTVFVLVFAGATILWAIGRNRTVTFDEARYPGLAALRRSTVIARYLGLVAGAVVFVLVAGLGRAGRGLFLAPAAAGAVLILAVMIGQQVAYGRARTSGVAAVERRLVRHYLPRGLSVSVVVLLGLLLAAGFWTTSAADVDGFGLERAFSATGSQTILTSAGAEVMPVHSTRSPFPGWFYTSMSAIGVPIVLALAAIALWLTARRPRNGADPELVPADDALRAQTAEGIMAGVGLTVSLSLFGVAAGAAPAVGGMGEFGIRYTVGAVSLAVVALGALVSAVWCAALLVVPGTRMARS